MNYVCKIVRKDFSSTATIMTVGAALTSRPTLALEPGRKTAPSRGQKHAARHTAAQLPTVSQQQQQRIVSNTNKIHTNEQHITNLQPLINQFPQHDRTSNSLLIPEFVRADTATLTTSETTDEKLCLVQTGVVNINFLHVVFFAVNFARTQSMLDNFEAVQFDTGLGRGGTLLGDNEIAIATNVSFMCMDATQTQSKFPSTRMCFDPETGYLSLRIPMGKRGDQIDVDLSGIIRVEYYTAPSVCET